MFSINSKSRSANTPSGWDIMGDPAVLAWSLAFFHYIKPSSASTVLSYSEGNVITIRGVPFWGIINPREDVDFYGKTTNIVSGQRWLYSTGTARQIQTNVLINRKSWEITSELMKSMYIQLREAYQNAQQPTSPSVTVILKKVDSGGTITTLKTFTIGSFWATWYSDYLQLPSGAIKDSTDLSSSINADDLVYLDIDVTATQAAYNWMSLYSASNEYAIFTA